MQADPSSESFERSLCDSALGESCVMRELVLVVEKAWKEVLGG